MNRVYITSDLVKRFKILDQLLRMYLLFSLDYRMFPWYGFRNGTDLLNFIFKFIERDFCGYDRILLLPLNGRGKLIFDDFDCGVSNLNSIARN